MCYDNSAYHGLHWYVDYPPDEREIAGQDLEMEDAAIIAFAVFVGIGYVQHNGAEWKGKCDLRFYIYRSPTVVD